MSELTKEKPMKISFPFFFLFSELIVVIKCLLCFYVIIVVFYRTALRWYNLQPLNKSTIIKDVIKDVLKDVIKVVLK